MRLHRFFVPEPVGSRTELIIRSSELVDQLRRVLRLKIGEEIVIFDGSGSDYKAAVARFDGADCVVLEHIVPSPSRFMPLRRLSLFMALVKKDKFETIVEKATELGVTDIVPIMAERSEKKSLNEARLRKIAIEASEQSGRGTVPVIHPVVGLREALDGMGEKTSVIAFHTEGDPLSAVDIGEDLGDLVILIGPEGGWSPVEVTLFHDKGVPIRCLGPQVLRAETAAIAALSQAVFGKS